MNGITRRKIADTKSSQSIEKILGQVKEFEGEQAEVNLAVPGHRRRRHISFEEYKALLVSGKTVLEICDMTSKHLVYFYNALLDGRITLSKEEFVRLYEAGVPLDEIAARHGISRNHVTYLREFYGIKRKGYTFQKRLSSEQPLSAEAKSVIIGSILGDGHIHPNGYWSEKHCAAQEEYLRWKASFVPQITTDKSFTPYEAYDKRFDKTFGGLSFRTRAHSWLHEMRGLFYRDGEKIVPENIADLLDEMSLAVWFMDDGNTDWGYRHGEKQCPNRRPACKIHTESFSYDDVVRLCRCLKNKFGIIGKPYEKNPCQWIIKIGTEDSAKFLAITRKHAVECLQYKFLDNA